MTRTRSILFFLLSIAVLLAAAIYNRFPLLYADSGTYIISGFTFQPPVDRPITYGLFIYVTSLFGVSPWFTLIAQAALLSWLLREIIFHIFPSENFHLLHLFACLVLSAFSGLSMVTSQLIPDIFTPVMILSLFLLIHSWNTTGKKKWIFLLVFFFACATHGSHVFIAAGTILLLMAIQFFRRKKEPFVLRTYLIALVTALSSILFMTTSFAKSSHVFQLGRLAQSGTLQAYLHDSCSSHHYAICDCADSIPMNADDVIWSRNNRIIEKAGGWQGSRDEVSGIIHNIYFTPHYLWMQVKSDASDLCTQLITFGSGEGLIDYDPHLPVREAVRDHFHNGERSYLNSAQHSGKMDKPRIFNFISYGAMIVSMLILISFLFMKDKNKMLSSFLLVSFVAYISNCAVCSSIVTVANRFGCRLSWIFVFLAFMIIVSEIQKRRSA